MKDAASNILIIGAGSWGTTLAAVLGQKGHHVWLWARNIETLNSILKEGKNKKYTADLVLPSTVQAFHSLADLPSGLGIVIFAVPSHALRSTVQVFLPVLKTQKMLQAIVNAAKGLEVDTNLRLSEVLSQTLPLALKNKIAVLSGPNISSEIAKKLPSVSTIASSNQKVMQWLQPRLSTDYFRVYTNKDLVGVEIGGAVKNIIAIAAGISDGLGFGTNTKASLVTRGLYEITRLGVKMGARSQTFSGISGMGDLITTCFSPHSRNRLFGQEIAQGANPQNLNQQMFMVAEGFNTTKAVFNLSQQLGLEMPIAFCTYDILYNNSPPRDSVFKLMNRKFKPEIEHF